MRSPGRIAISRIFALLICLAVARLSLADVRLLEIPPGTGSASRLASLREELKAGLGIGGDAVHTERRRDLPNSACTPLACVATLQEAFVNDHVVVPTLRRTGQGLELRLRIASPGQPEPDLHTMVLRGQSGEVRRWVEDNHLSWFVVGDDLDWIPLPEDDLPETIPLPDLPVIDEPAPAKPPSLSDHPLLLAGISTLGAASVAAMIGVAFGSLANAQARRLPDSPELAPDTLDAVSAAAIVERNRELALGANVSFGLAGALALSGAALVVIDRTVLRRTEKSKSAAFDLRVAPGAAAFSLSFRF